VVKKVAETYVSYHFLNLFFVSSKSFSLIFFWIHHAWSTLEQGVDGLVGLVQKTGLFV
jgi:hypothetical protein